MSRKKLRLLFISRSMPPTIGGIEKQNESIARHLEKKTTCKTILNRGGKKLLPLFLIWAAINGSVQAKKNDAVLLGDGLTTCIGWIIKIITRKPIICIIHGLDVTWQNIFYQKIWVRFFFKKVDQFIAVSNHTKLIAIENGINPDKIIIIPNGTELIENDDFKSTKMVDLISEDISNKFIILSLGRLVKRKGIDWFVKNVIPKLSDDYLYIIAGDGPELNNILNTISKTKQQHKVITLGKVSNKSKNTLFKYSDIFIQPNIPIKSDIEGFGITMIEAGMHGTPTIASNLEGIKDAISDGKNGWLVEPLNAKEFAYKINQKRMQLEKDKRKIRDKTKVFCKENFNWNNITNEYIQIISDVK